MTSHAASVQDLSISWSHMRLQISRALKWLVAGLVPPIAAFALSYAAWPLLQPYAWFLFFSAIFLSAQTAGFGAGLIATLISTALAWWFFVPPANALATASIRAIKRRSEWIA